MSRRNFKVSITPTGKQIRKALIDIDQTPIELAHAVGVTAYYIREIYAERRKAVATRKKIAAYLAEQLKKNKYPLPGWAKEHVA